jgi:ATPase subunit of ABC transporter with duplicated ATPase domains
MAATIVARGLSFELPDGRELLRDLDLSLDEGLTALVGPNGVGKTCLARLLAAELAPAAGVVQRHLPVSLLCQRQDPEPITVAELLGDHAWSPVSAELLREIDPDSPCTMLSGGQWMRVRLARALGDHYLILDEPTNDLDREGREAIEAFLRHHDRGALVISHDRELLASCREILELSNRGLAVFRGGWSAYTEAREQERERLEAALDLAKRERDAALVRKVEQSARLEKRSRQGAAAAARAGLPPLLAGARKRRAQVTSGRLSAQALQKSQEAVRAAHEALAELKVDPVMYARLSGHELPSGKLVAEARGFNVCFGDWLYLRDLDFTWRGGVRVAIRGGNGSGKTTLVKALLGESFRTRGELRLGGASTLYIDQRCSLLDDRRSLLDNVSDVAHGSTSQLRTALAAFLFTGDSVFQKAGDLSGGERLRLALARAFLGSRQPELLMLDEPTNNLDLQNVAFLERVVRGFRGALVVISHDEQFLASCDISQELRVGPP